MDYVKNMVYRNEIKGYCKRSEHLHKNLKSAANLKRSYTGINRFEVSKSGIEEMKAWEVNILHLIQIYHTFIYFLIPSHPCLFFFTEFL